MDSEERERRMLRNFATYANATVAAVTFVVIGAVAVAVGRNSDRLLGVPAVVGGVAVLLLIARARER